MKTHIAFVLVLLLPGCGSLQRLSEVGRPPTMSPSSDPTADPAYRPITMPMPRPQTEPAEANSLGAKAAAPSSRISVLPTS